MEEALYDSKVASDCVAEMVALAVKVGFGPLHGLCSPHFCPFY